MWTRRILVITAGLAALLCGAPPAVSSGGDVAKRAAELRGTDPVLAEAAAVALGKTVTGPASEALLDALAMGLPPAVSDAALTALVNHPSANSYTVLAAYTRHRSDNLRASALTALGASRDARAKRLVLAGLDDIKKSVRRAAAVVVAKRKWTTASDLLLKLLDKGDEAAVPALAALADGELARRVAERIGSAPAGSIARCLGGMLVRRDFGPDSVRVQAVRALAKLPGAESVEALSAYLAAVPEKPTRKSRVEAEAAIEKLLSEGVE